MFLKDHCLFSLDPTFLDSVRITCFVGETFEKEKLGQNSTLM